MPRFPFSPYSIDKAGNWGAADLWPYSCYVDGKIHYWLAAGPVTWQVEAAKAVCAHRYRNGSEHTGACNVGDGCHSTQCCQGYCCQGSSTNVTSSFTGQCMPSLPAANSYWTKIDAVKRTLIYEDGLYFQIMAPWLSGTWSAKPSNFGSPTKFSFSTAAYAGIHNNGMVFMALDQLSPGFSGEHVLASPIDGSWPYLSGVANKLVYVDRGVLNLSVVVWTAQRAGAVGVVIGDVNDSFTFAAMSYDWTGRAVTPMSTQSLYRRFWCPRHQMSRASLRSSGRRKL